MANTGGNGFILTTTLYKNPINVALIGFKKQNTTGKLETKL